MKSFKFLKQIFKTINSFLFVLSFVLFDSAVNTKSANAYPVYAQQAYSNPRDRQGERHGHS